MMCVELVMGNGCECVGVELVMGDGCECEGVDARISVVKSVLHSWCSAYV